MKNKYFIVTLLLIFLTITDLYTQSNIERYLQQQDSAFNVYQNNNQQDLKNYVNKEHFSYLQYRDSINREFAQFLNQDWDSHPLKKNKQVIITKPITIPVYAPGNQLGPIKLEPKLNKLLKTDNCGQLPTDDLSNRIDNEVLKTLQEYSRATTYKDQFTFYGGVINIFYDDLKFDLPTINNISISQAWTQLSKTNYLPIIYQLQEYRQEFNLNDWGHLLLVKELGHKLYSDPNKITLFTWFILTNAGYNNIKTGYLNKKLYLLVPSSLEIYQTYFYEKINYNLYVFDLENIKNSIKGITYYENTPEIETYSDSFLSVRINEFNFITSKPVDFNKYKKVKEFSFKFNDDYITFNITYDTQAVAFYNDFPACQPEFYFTTQLSKTALESLSKEFEPFLKGKTNIQKIQFLLSFTQKAFNYQVDQKQFGYERWLYPEEVLMYPFSDCEDRSVFFAQLVNYFLDLKVIGLKFPQHISTAVYFNDNNIKGSYIRFKNEKYIICDPTYLYSKVGDCTPDLENIKPEIIIYGDFTKKTPK